MNKQMITMYESDLLPPLDWKEVDVPLESSMYETYLQSLLNKKKMHDTIDDSEIEAVTSSSSSSNRFEDLNLSPELIKGLYVEMKFEMPTKIQSMSLPIVLTPPPYKNLFAQASIGSGKTTCSVLAILTRVHPNLHAPQALCFSPTPKFATPIMEVLVKMRKFTGITSELCHGYIPVSNTAPLTAQVIVGSPEALVTWILGNKLDTTNLKIVVFDEADITLGGCEKVSVTIMKEIVRWTPECQVLLFSCSDAYNNDHVKAFESTIVKDLFVQEFQQLSVDMEEPPSFNSVKQYNVNVPDDEPSKITVIKDKIVMGGMGDGVLQAVIFVETRETAGMLHEAFVKDGYAVKTIPDRLLNIEEHRKINKEFKDGLIRVLIVTAACFLTPMIDLSQVNLVINYDLPVQYGARLPDPEGYFRSLVTAGQFGRKAAVFNLLCGNEDSKIMEKMATHLNCYITELPSPPSDDDFKDALKKAGLMGIGH